jgi:hypothetical protein
VNHAVLPTINHRRRAAELRATLEKVTAPVGATDHDETVNAAW